MQNPFNKTRSDGNDNTTPKNLIFTCKGITSAHSTASGQRHTAGYNAKGLP
jgi:hypothetical protein